MGLWNLVPSAALGNFIDPWNPCSNYSYCKKNTLSDILKHSAQEHRALQEPDMYREGIIPIAQDTTLTQQHQDIYSHVIENPTR